MGLAVARTEMEVLFETLAEKSPFGVYIVQDGKFCYANPAFRSCIGYRENELAGMDSLEFVFPEDREKVRENAIKMLKGEVTSAYQFRVIDKTGGIRWVMESVSPIQYRGRQATLGNYMDITERKEVEEALQVEKNKLQSLIDAMEYSLTIQDTQYNIIYQNERSRIGAGGDHLGEKCYRTYGFRDKVCPECPVAMAFRDGESHTVERRKVMPSGQVAFWENTANPIRDAGGRIVACLELARDITGRKKAEEELAKGEEKLRKMFESVSDGVSVIDLEGIITEVNQRTMEMHGFNSRDELQGRSAFELVAPGDHERIAANMKKAITQGGIRGVECTLLRADGSEFPGELSTSVLKDASGNPVGHITIARDISERKKMQEQLMLTDRLASIGQLVSGIAHELNNPLTGVIGFSGLLLRRDLPADLKDDLETVNGEAMRASNIVKGLLAFAYQQGTEKALVDINSIIQDVLRLRSYDQRVNNIKVVARLATDLPQVLGNGAQLQQVFINIIINAEQAMLEAQSRGRLTVTTERVGDVVRASIADDGPGISPDDMKRLFTPFFTTKEVGKGTGLGLSICHGIVTEHGGKVYAESEPGEGATFVVELPIGKQSGKGCA
ncbi:MAG: PAS domain S-box protein [Dehalococcoidia bacterium]